MAKYKQPTKPMLDFFKQRTQEHINRVRKYMHHLHGFEGLTSEDLTSRALDHDKDKYSDPKLIVPYIWVTEYYRIKNGGNPISEELQSMFDLSREATGVHVERNLHHPEAHESVEDMDLLDLAEMVCDWAAMGEELNQGSPRGWADKNVGSKWKFTPKQTKTIYDLITHLENKGAGKSSKAGYRCSEPTLTSKLKLLRPKIVDAVQKVLDEWKQDEQGFDELYGYGGACDDVAIVIQEVLDQENIRSMAGGHEGDDHLWIIAFSVSTKEAVGIDIPAGVYECGGGYSWKKKPNVVLSPEDVVLFSVPYEDIEEEVEWEDDTRQGTFHRKADTKRELFRKYAEQWGKSGIAWAKEILDDERKHDSGEEVWEEFAGYVPREVKKIDPFKFVKANMWIFDNMPKESQWAADLIVKNAKQHGIDLGDVKTGKHGVEADPSRYKRYMNMPAGAPPSFMDASSGDIAFGVGRFIAALLRNDDFMYVIPFTFSEKEKKEALEWLQQEQDKEQTKTTASSSNSRKAASLRKFIKTASFRDLMDLLEEWKERFGREWITEAYQTARAIMGIRDSMLNVLEKLEKVEEL